MDILKIIEFLQESKHRKFLDELQNRNDLSLNKIQELNQKFPEYPVKDLLTLISIQKKNLTKNPDSMSLLFTAKGAEQASSQLLAQYHADKFQEFSCLADLCCGNGIDLMHLAAGKQKVYAVDNDRTALETARYNTADLDNIEFIEAEAEKFAMPTEAIFIDPDRRNDDRRLIDVNAMTPPFSALIELLSRTPNLAIKLSPAADYKNLKLNISHTFEFVSEKGVLKEILLCFGSLASAGIIRKAVLLPAGIELTDDKKEVSIAEIGKYLFEPDVAIIRAGLVQQMGAQIGYHLIDHHLALLSSNDQVQTRFGNLYRVLEYFSYDLKKLRRYCRENLIGELVIKTRGFPMPVEKFRARIKLKGKGRVTLFIVRWRDKHLMILTGREF